MQVFCKAYADMAIKPGNLLPFLERLRESVLAHLETGLTLSRISHPWSLKKLP